MDLPLNHNQPLIMHVDLNSCFATCEQQASPLLRGKPIVVAAYNSPNGCVVAPSIEAKQFGIKTGMIVRDAKVLCPQVIVKTPDPPKYRAIHLQFKKIFQDYSPDVVPKSIDEAIIDFTHTYALHKKTLTEIGMEIKRRMREEIGEWIRCNIGIGTNRFLAKTAAGLHKPDGLDIITHENLRSVYQKLKLTDLCGINTRYEARLTSKGIFTPLQFVDAPLQKLQKEVFQSINGYYWYLRLRGWEIDEVEFKRKSFGQSYALGNKTADKQELSRLLMKLTEKMARRMRKAKFAAQGVHVALVYTNWTYWHKGRTFDMPLYTTEELFKKVMLLFNSQPNASVVAKLAVSCFDLVPVGSVQASLFDTDFEKRRQVSDALDTINDKYGEYVITPALMMGMDDLIVDRVAFGGVKELQELYI